MRIVRLTPRIEKWLLARRARQDDKAKSPAAEFVANARKRGDAALFAWTKKLDHYNLAREGFWISKRKTRSGVRNMSPASLNAEKRAAKNVRSVAKKQLPRLWSFES